MRSKSIFVVWIALATCVLVYPRSASARNSSHAAAADPSVPSAVVRREASLMVPAQAVLEKAIDARKMQPGEQFRATLRGTVHLKSGLELPRDTVLLGTIATDQMRDGGTSTLALRFTKAQLKDGKVVPIQAAIMGVSAPSDGDAWEYGDPAANLPRWDGKTLQIDELGALSGVDFHGRIGSPNSGVFVSTKKDEMKLSPGSQLSLAIAARGASRMNGGA